MCAAAADPFPTDALEANRRGELSAAQRQGFGNLARARRKSSIGTAGFLLAGALLIGLFASPSAPMLWRVLIAGTCLAIAAFLVLRAVTGSDPLSRDLRDVHVAVVEGAIGKRRVANGRTTSYFLEVGERRFGVGSLTFGAAPEAGYVRLYYLPHSRKLVNLERLPDRPVAPGTTVQDVVHSLGAALLTPGRRERNEARAALAGIGHAFQAALQPGALPAPGHELRPLGDALVGTWSNAFATATFAADGRLTTRILGRERSGHWSVDADGHLHADLTGQPQAVEARVAGEQLTVALDGELVTFTRQA
ncbi:MAG TPA: hypothetical protein VMU00_09180 [Steroidobacteraceae bacterium]|nr:hypothetical protein [Steroidobacteraceae bacterium]